MRTNKDGLSENIVDMAKSAFDAASGVNCYIDDGDMEGDQVTRSELIDAIHCIELAISHLQDALTKLPPCPSDLETDDRPHPMSFWK